MFRAAVEGIQVISRLRHGDLPLKTRNQGSWSQEVKGGGMVFRLDSRDALTIRGLLLRTQNEDHEGGVKK